MRLGRYELKDRLALGGMGEVWLARRVGPKAFSKPLVIKLLLPHLAEDRKAVASFLAEARLAASMNHPNVVQVFDAGEAEGRFFLAMELVDGVSLAALIRGLRESGEHVSLDLWLEVARGLCDGLHHAHELCDASGHPLDLVHRDVSPQNLMVSSSGQVKLTDFGIAKFRSANATRSGGLKGKLAYVSPEQVAAQPVDRRADIFSAAVTLFELATLESPFERGSDAACLQAICKDPLPALTELRGDFPAELQEVLERAASKNPRRRHATARDLKAQLPVPRGDAREALGALVSRVCAQQLERLEEQSTRSRHTRATGTLDTPRHRRVFMVSLAGGALLAGAWFGRQNLADAVEALVESRSPPGPVVPPADGQERDEPARLTGTAANDDGARPRPPVRRPSPDGEDAPPAGSARPAPKAALGYLTVDALPWAKVSVRGRVVGETPLAAFPLEQGTAVIQLENPQTGRSVSRKVRVRAGQTVFLREDLR